MNNVRRIALALALLSAAKLPSPSLHAGQSPGQQVINIEAAMRAVQERYQKSRGQGSDDAIWWWPNKEFIEPGPFPEDGFYCEDLADPEFAAQRVDDLFWEVVNLPFIDPETMTADRVVGLAGEAWLLYPPEGVTAENYREVFQGLVTIINRMRFIQGRLSRATQDDVNFKCANGVSGQDSCETDRTALIDDWFQGDPTCYHGWPANVQQQAPAMTQNYNVGFEGETDYIELFASYRDFDYSGGFEGAARFYLGVEENLKQSSGSVFGDWQWLALPSLVETFDAGQAWTSAVYGPTDEDATGFGFDCQRTHDNVSGFITRTLYWRGRVSIELPISLYVDEVYVPLEDCASCQACEDSCEPGDLEVENACLDVRIGLGSGAEGSMGFLKLFSEAPSDDLDSLSGLEARLKQPTDLRFEESPEGRRLRQAKLPQAIVDLVELDAYSYEVRFYPPDGVAAEDENGLLILEESPLRVIRVENLDRTDGPVERLKVTREEGGSAQTHRFEWLRGKDWVLVSDKGHGAVTTTLRTTELVEDGWVETVEILDDGGTVVSREEMTYRVFPWNAEPGAVAEGELVSRTVGLGDEIDVTSYSYWEEEADPVNYGRLRLMLGSDGYWERYRYDSLGRVRETVAPFLNAPPEASVGVRVLENDVHDDEYYEQTVESVVLPEGTFETGRTYRMFDWNAIRTIHAHTPGAAMDDPKNLVSLETYYEDDSPWHGKRHRLVQPDGTGALWEYARNGENLVEIVYRGVFDETESAIIDGTRSETVKSAAGVATAFAEWDIASGIELSSWSAAAYDHAGRVTRVEHSDGTSEERSYGCCGLAYKIDREGARTDYLFENGLLAQTVKDGVATRFEYDGLDRVIGSTRVGTDGSEVELSRREYSAAGDLISETQYGNRTTRHDEHALPDGSRELRVTYPDGAIRIERIARDGQLLEITGTAVPAVAYQYGFDVDGRWMKELRPSGGEPATEWTLTRFDFFGNRVAVQFADGAEMTWSHDALGRVVSETDPDGVTRLFQYNARGEREITAIDMDGNGSIDPAGEDRITRISNELGYRDAIPVRRRAVSRWEQFGIDMASLVSQTETSVDGLQSWHSSFGRTEHSVTAYGPDGLRLERIIQPSGVSEELEYRAGRLLATRQLDTQGVVLKETTYRYDAHGRLMEQEGQGVGLTRFTYTAADEVASITTPDPDPDREGEGYDPQTTYFEYDAMGRVTKVIHPDGSASHKTYWPSGQVRRTWGSRSYPVGFQYDLQGRQIAMTTWQDFAAESGAATTTWSYDAERGWLAEKGYASATPGPRYEYTAAGRLQKRVWARGVETRYEYNAAGDLTGVDYSDSITSPLAWRYDRAGRIASSTDASGIAELLYSHGRIQSERYIDGYLRGHELARGLDSFGRTQSLDLAKAEQSLHSMQYVYDGDTGRLREVAGSSLTHAYAYDERFGQVSQVLSSSSAGPVLTSQTERDSLGRVKGVQSSGSFGTRSHAYEYSQANQRVRATAQNGQYWIYSYDDLGQLVLGEQFDPSGAPLPGRSLGYGFDDIGNQIQHEANGRDGTLQRNALNQIESRQNPPIVDVVGEAAREAEVTVNGTMASRQGRWFHAATTADNAAGPAWAPIRVDARLAGAGSEASDALSKKEGYAYLPPATEVFQYDADGNLLADGRWSYEWNGENRLVAMETRAEACQRGIPCQRLEFAYDGQGRRFRKRTLQWSEASGAFELGRETRWLYDGWNPVFEETSDSYGEIERASTYTWGIDLSGAPQRAGGVGGMLAVTRVEEDSTESTYLPCYDGNGNITAYIAAESANLAAAFDYGPFGEPIGQTGPAADKLPHCFSTKYTDPETGLLYYGFRYYNPATARWLSRDPIDILGGLNLYGFLSNDPANAIDKYGLVLYAFDGTNNDRARDRWGNPDAPNAPTNIAIMTELYEGQRFYTHGVGTRTDILLGNLNGRGGHERMNSMFEDFKRYYCRNPKEPIDIIGFSRGAAMARNFANKIRKEYPNAKIRFLGIYDTVAQIGFPDSGNSNHGYDLSISPDIGRVAHAIAMNEHRDLFPLTSISTDYKPTFLERFWNGGDPNRYGPDDFKTKSGFNYIEKPFIGAHSDIGGGYKDGRSLFALRWMIRQAQQAGAPFRDLEKYQDFDKLRPISEPHDSRYPFIDFRNDDRTVFPGNLN